MKILTMPEALKIVSDNAHGVKMNYFDTYLPAILMVNERWPHVGNTLDIDDDSAAFEAREWARAQADTWDLRHSR